MASINPQTLQRDFSLGMRRDRSREGEGANSLWTSYDWIINRLGAPLAKRGPWAYAGDVFTGSPGRVRAGVDGPFNGGHWLLAVDSDGNVYRTAGGSPGVWAIDGTTEVVGPLLQNPIFFLDTVVIPAKDTSSSLYLANENTVIPYVDCAITHRPTRLTKWKSRIVGASGEFFVFGPPIGDAGTLVGVAWDEDSKYAVSQPIVAIHEMRGAILLFYSGFMERVRGTTPAGYGVLTDDILREDLFGDVGCVDAFSVTEWNDMVVWADRKGIYYTDGAAPVDLTEQGGIKDYFTSIMADYSPDWRVSSGVFDNLLFTTIYDLNADVEIITFVCDLPKRIFYHFSNFPFSCFIRNLKGVDELWAGVAQTDGRVATVKGLLLEEGKEDANSQAIMPYLESVYLRYANGPQRVLDLYVGYELMGNQQDVQTLVVDALAGSYQLFFNGVGGLFIVFDESVSDLEDVLNSAFEFGAWSSFGLGADNVVVTGTVGDYTITFSEAITSAFPTGVPFGVDPSGLSGGGATATIAEITVGALPRLEVSTSTDPRIDPVFFEFGDGTEVMDGGDLFGTIDERYHYKRVTVNTEGAGIVYRIAQANAVSRRTSIYNISGSLIPLPGNKQM